MRLLFLLMASSLILLGCKKPEGCTDPAAINYDNDAILNNGTCEYECEGCAPYTLSGTVTANTTLPAGVYTMVGKYVVPDGVTLTIEPGVIIKGEEGTGTLASALIVSKGGTLNACGTASQPIIFTSVLDNIQPGQLTGTNLTLDDKGLWGGLIILGDAPVSAADGDDISQLEGIPSTSNFGQFGGNNPGDNSGNLCYVSIRHAGALIGAGNELGGLTLGGVGNNTLLRNIEIVAGQDDGLDIMGGTVDVSNVFVGFMGDDCIDLDMNYDGTVLDFVVYQGAGGDEGLEVDGPEGTTYVDGSFTLTNGTFINTNNLQPSQDFKDGAQGTVNNVDFNGDLWFDLFYNANCSLDTCVVKNILDTPAKLVFNSIDRANIELRTLNTNTCSLTPQQQTNLDALTAPGNPTGNSNTDNQWTWLYANGYL